MHILLVSRDCFAGLRREDKRGNWIPVCAGMTGNPLFIKVLGILNYPFRNAL